MTEALTSRNFAAGDTEDFENLIRRKLYVDKTSFLEVEILPLCDHP